MRPQGYLGRAYHQRAGLCGSGGSGRARRAVGPVGERRAAQVHGLRATRGGTRGPCHRQVLGFREPPDQPALALHVGEQVPVRTWLRALPLAQEFVRRLQIAGASVRSLPRVW